MTTKASRLTAGIFLAVIGLVVAMSSFSAASAQTAGPEMLPRDLAVRTVADGFLTPINMAFLGDDDFLLLEKNTGRVLRVVGGVAQDPVLDLAVNFGSERGLLGIALHPYFPDTPWVYLYWTQSRSGVDTNLLSDTPLLGNRVDRYVWDGSSLVFNRNLIRLRAIQQDAGQPERGNHDGGVIKFGHDGKLYIFIGDVGRRGWMQNLRCGPTPTCPGPVVPDDQFGGPEPDNAHLTGVILRLNDDGTTPRDNPLFAAGASIAGQAGRNIQKVYSYGHRNSFGMAVDPQTGLIWLQENGDDSFSELNRIEPGMNGGWIQIMGPVDRIDQFKEIETTFGPMTLQQLRWPPTNIADSPEEALARLFLPPGAHYSDPEFSWKWEVAPGGMAFVEGPGLGEKYEGDLFVGAATPNLEGGYLFRFEMSRDRMNFAFSDPRIEDLVADNLAKHDITESESLLIGRNFGTSTEMEVGPNGNLYVVSISNGAVYEIYRP